MANLKLLLPLALLTVFAVPAAQAADYKGISYSVEPIVGYELQRKENPDRSKLVLTYGARVIAGYKILSAEAEYLIGNSDEVFSNGNRVEEKSEKIRAGLRSTYAIGSMLDWFLRAGAETQKLHRKSTTSGIVTESDTPTKVYPYVGTGVSIALGSTLSLNGSVTATLKDLNDLKQTEYSTTLGIKIALNTAR
jgi:hypothetical protein